MAIDLKREVLAALMGVQLLGRGSAHHIAMIVSSNVRQKVTRQKISQTLQKLTSDGEVKYLSVPQVWTAVRWNDGMAALLNDPGGPAGLEMTVDDGIAFAHEWSKGMTFHAGSQGWRVVCRLLADEIERLRRGEFICQKCGIRKDSECSHGDF